MNEHEIAEISRAPGTISWAALVESSLSGSPDVMHFAGLRSKRLDEVWLALRKEVFDLLCTDSAKYAKERAAFTATLKPAIVALSALLSKDYGLPAAAASSLAGLALILPARMLKDAWCSTFNSATVTEGEKTELRSLIQENAIAKPAT